MHLLLQMKTVIMMNASNFYYFTFALVIVVAGCSTDKASSGLFYEKRLNSYLLVGHDKARLFKSKVPTIPYSFSHHKDNTFLCNIYCDEPGTPVTITKKGKNLQLMLSGSTENYVPIEFVQLDSLIIEVLNSDSTIRNTIHIKEDLDRPDLMALASMISNPSFSMLTAYGIEDAYLLKYTLHARNKKVITKRASSPLLGLKVDELEFL